MFFYSYTRLLLFLRKVNLSILQLPIGRSVRLHMIIWPDKLQEQPQQCKLLWLFAALRTPADRPGASLLDQSILFGAVRVELGAGAFFPL